MADLYCTVCGDEYEIGDAFCSSCGHPIDKTKSVQNQEYSVSVAEGKNELTETAVSTASDATNAVSEPVGQASEKPNTVKPDIPDKLKNLYELARRARNDGNSSKACRYYEQIAIEAPDSWEAEFFTVYYPALQKWKKDENGEALDMLEGCLNSVFGLIEDIDDSQEMEEALQEVDDFTTDLIDKIWEETYAAHEKVKIKVMFDNSAEAGNYKRASANLKGLIALSIADIHESIADKRAELFDSKEATKLSIAQWDLAKVLVKSGSERVLGSGDKRARIETLDTKMKSQEKIASERRFKAYWSAHQNERADLESNKQALEAQIAALTGQIDTAARNTEGYTTMLELQNRVSSLENEKRALGLFKRKERKAVQEQIDSVHTQIAPIKARVDAAMNEIRQLIAPLQKRVDEIDEELTMPR